jgi:uncharacterized protein (TIGR03435 family)
MIRMSALIGLLVLTAGLARTQPAGTLPTFGIADVHVNTWPMTLGTAGTRGAILRAGGRYEFTNATMLDLIRTAYGVDADKVLGGPTWLESDRFDILAQAPPRTTPDQAKLMLQALLAERFKLATHKDSRQLPTYGLSVARGGHKLKPASDSEPPGCKGDFKTEATQATTAAGAQVQLMMVTGFTYVCHSMTMAAFADQMHTMLVAQAYIGNNPVIDQTGLAGEWDFNFKYTQKAAPAALANDQPRETITLFDAMEKQLGLKLDPLTAPIPVIVVDSVNRKPTENSPEVSAALPPPPSSEFEVAEIRLSVPGETAAGSRGFQPNGQIDLHAYPLKSLIGLGWNINNLNSLVGAPKWLDSVRVDLIAKMPVTGPPVQGQGVDIDAIRPALRALLTDRFKVAIHTEMRPGEGWVLKADKPKLKAANPANRTLCKEGPGADGKDPRTANPAVGRLLTCQNMTMAEFAEQLPLRASGYFRVGDQVVDSTGLAGAYDFTLSFSGAGLVPGANRDAIVIVGGRGGDAPPTPGASAASDPNGAISLTDALLKQLGLKLETEKRQVSTIVLDHVEEKPSDN